MRSRKEVSGRVAQVAWSERLPGSFISRHTTGASGKQRAPTLHPPRERERHPGRPSPRPTGSDRRSPTTFRG